MHRKLAALAVVASLAVAGAACSSSNTASTTTTASTAAGTSTTAAGTGKLPTGQSLPKVTKPTTNTKADTSKLPQQAQKAASISEFSEDENNCVALVIIGATDEDPTIAQDSNKLAGAIGGAMVACVPQEKIAKGLADAIGSGGNLDSTQTQCVQNEIASASADDLAFFLGVLITQNEALMQPFAQALSAACNIPM